MQGPPGQKGDVGATEIIDYNGNIQEALQVRPAVAAKSNPSDFRNWDILRCFLVLLLWNVVKESVGMKRDTCWSELVFSQVSPFVKRKLLKKEKFCM